MRTDQKWYRVVTFGSPRAANYPAYRRSEALARGDASAAMGTGTCTSARVYECDTRALALSADISVVRGRERIVYHA